LECPWGLLSLGPHIVAKSLCSCLRLFDVTVELYAMNEKMLNEFLIRK